MLYSYNVVYGFCMLEYGGDGCLASSCSDAWYTIESAGRCINATRGCLSNSGFNSRGFSGE